MLSRMGMFLGLLIAITYYIYQKPPADTVAVNVEKITSKKINPTILYSKQSPFGLIEVIASPKSGILYICEDKNYKLAHSSILQGDATYMGSAYEPLATSSFCFAKNVKSVLLLGLGGGEFLSYFANYFSDAQVDVVEINPAIIEIVKKFRKIDSKNTIEFICKDAFKHIAIINKNYDLIYCDAYFFKPSIAKEYKDFFERAKKRLNEGGVFVWNSYRPFIPQVVVADMFKNFENVTVAITDEGSNIVFVCYQGPKKTKQDLDRVAENMQKQHNFRYALPDMLQKFEFIPLADYETWITKFPVLS